MVARRVPEAQRPGGVRYALTDDGVELPVIDVTHPAFRCEPGEAELGRLTERSLQEMRRFSELPAVARWLLSRLLSRGFLTREISRASGSYLSGMGTYLLKLPPPLLGPYARRIDRTVAQTLPCVSVRLRLHRTARLLAEAISSALHGKAERPLALWNIAGGPAADSLNALLIVRADRPGLLESRRVAIEVLDLDPVGPRFGARSLDALQAEGAPLAGLAVTLRHVAYDWRRPAGLGEARSAGDGLPLVVCSSEGGLFEYGSDEDVAENLGALRDRTPSDAVIVGSICRGDGPAGEMNRRSGAALQPRTLDRFAALVRAAGWEITRTEAVPLAWCVALRRT